MGFIINDQDKVWPMGQIPYRILSSDIRADVLQVINHWNQVIGSHVCYIPKTTTHNDYVSLDSTTEGISRSSGAGRTGGEQQVLINRTRVMRLTNVDAKSRLIAGVILHELGHAAGLLHEHQRHDRDDYVTIHWEKISSCHNFWSTASYDIVNCKTAPKLERQQQYKQAHCINSYDFDSVMHYLSTHSLIQTKNNQAADRTITRNGVSTESYNENNFEPFQGHLRATLSEGDKNSLRALYPLLIWNAITNSRRNFFQAPANEGQETTAPMLEQGVLGSTALTFPLGVLLAR